LAGKRLVVNCNANDFYITQSDRKEACPGHFRFGKVTEVEEFATERTSPREILQHFKQETGEAEGCLELGREIVVELKCARCGTSELSGEPMGAVDEDRERCPQCGIVRELETTHSVCGDEPYADWPLSRLGVPRLDVLEVQGSQSTLWYEMTGDLDSFPEIRQKELSTDSTAANVA
jgi:hypothetical protein